VSVEGKTLAETARVVATQVGLSPENVRLRVRDYKSQQIYLVGQVAGHQRTVPYQGPETVADLLQRIGGITPGAEAGNIRVVRAHIPDGRPPEVFTVDLKAIYLRNDEQTNLVLEPFDQVYVGEMKRSSLGNCFPRWIRPVYEKLLGLRPAGEKWKDTPSSDY
jgi:protein involved in polysaccharide export with SLBB domain